LPSRSIQPLIKGRIDSLKHFSVNLPLIGELLAPSRVILLFSFKFRDEFIDQRMLMRIFLSEMLLAEISGFLLSMFGSQAHIGVLFVSMFSQNAKGSARIRT
jgi:hypothetical protein